MWDGWEYRERPADGSTIIWSWVIVALILVGVLAWSTLDQVMTNATAPVAVSRDVPGSGENPDVFGRGGTGSQPRFEYRRPLIPGTRPLASPARW